MELLRFLFHFLDLDGACGEIVYVCVCIGAAFDLFYAGEGEDLVAILVDLDVCVRKIEGEGVIVLPELFSRNGHAREKDSGSNACCKNHFIHTVHSLSGKRSGNGMVTFPNIINIIA